MNNELRDTKKKQSQCVIAVDPGYDRVGIAVLSGYDLLHSECLVPAQGAFPERLRTIFVHLKKIIAEYNPDSLAIETLFFTKNQKTAIRVAEARGVIELAGAEANIPVHEYSPQEVKLAVTGTGNATKEGVTKMVRKLVSLPDKKRFDDEYDAIALGIAHQANTKFKQAKERK
jgi:crossover junction endodeoxyribonuclease RuvC